MRWIVLAFIIIFVAASCSPDSAERDRIVTAANAAASALRSQVSQPAAYSPLVPAILVDVDDFKASSKFGRMFSEMVAAELAKKGFLISDVRIRQNLLILQEEGEFILSRDVKRLAARYNIGSALAGVYAVGERDVFVSLKIIDVKSGSTIISAHNLTIPFNGNIITMLGIAS